MSKATAQDVFKAFKQYRAWNKDWTKLEIFSDESGAVIAAEGGAAVFCFTSFDEAVAVLTASKPQPKIDDVIAYGNYLFKVTALYNGASSLRADRAAYGDPDFTIYVPCARLKSRAPYALTTWDVE